jgi:site-specific recombinase XerD
LRDGFALSLQAEGKATKTLSTYLDAVDALLAFAADKGMPELGELTAEHLREFVGSLYARGNKPATVSNRYRALRRFFGWLRDEGERTDNPLERIKPPRIPEQVLAHYESHEVEALLAACDSRSYTGTRDRAIILTLYDTGLRASELTGITLQNLNSTQGTVLVRGKFGKERVVSLGSRTALAINRFIRSRQRRRYDDVEALWVSERRSQLSVNGLRMMLERRAKAAGITYKGIHAFRRTSAIAFLEAGGYPDDLQTLMGWESA